MGISGLEGLQAACASDYAIGQVSSFTACCCFACVCVCVHACMCVCLIVCVRVLVCVLLFLLCVDGPLWEIQTAFPLNIYGKQGATGQCCLVTVISVSLRELT